MILTAIFWAGVHSAMAAELRVIPPEQLNRFELTGDVIPQTRGEQILVRDTRQGPFRVTRLAVLLMVPFGRVAGAAQALVQTTYGEASSRSEVGGRVPSGPEEKRRLQAQHLRLERFTLRTIVSRPYNVLSADSFSQLHLQVVDGQDVFDTCSSLLLVSRVDHYRDWPRDNSLHTGLPVFPWRFPVEGSLVTTTELRFLDDLRSRLGVTAAPQFAVLSNYEVLPETTVLERIKTTLDGVRGSGEACK